jgi:4-hydroxythreonine-4-phosphate dehydrogenase
MADIVPRLCITMGCPAGIGPEILVKALAKGVGYRYRSHIVVIGDAGILESTARSLGLSLPIKVVSSLQDTMVEDIGHIHILSVTSLKFQGKSANFSLGRPNAITGKASYAYIKKALELCDTGDFAGIVTCPISKIGLQMAGIAAPGHTEILAEHTRTKRFAMMLAGASLRVVLVTIHCALRNVASQISQKNVLEIISLTHEALQRDFGIDAPRIAVAALNPHAGESGMFGDEEERILKPAIAETVRQGIQSMGPYPPDTVFHRAVQGEFHVVVCQYHDQGLIPFKLLHFKDGVNVTLGLPIVRTSVDHGTAYDIAGRGIADESSLNAAIEIAFTMAINRRKRREQEKIYERG